jgi:rsbT co-antagonist protein RsbR
MSEQPTATSPDEVSLLRQQIAELEQKLAAAERERDIFKHVVLEAPAFISRLAPDGRVIWANKACERITGYSAEEMVGRNLLPVLYPGELMRAVEEYFKIAAEGGDVRDYELTIQCADGQQRTLAWNSYHRFGADGTLQEVVSFGVDVTERKRNETERRKLQDEIIEMQAATLAELSTPLIPLGANIVAMPLIGAIDESRADRIMHTLLSGITDMKARTAILDITGVNVVDTAGAEALLRAAGAARLLGAEVILTGIRPDVAQTLVGLGTNLERVVTLGTLQGGIDYAMKRR